MKELRKKERLSTGEVQNQEQILTGDRGNPEPPGKFKEIKNR